MGVFNQTGQRKKFNPRPELAIDNKWDSYVDFEETVTNPHRQKKTRTQNEENSDKPVSKFIKTAFWLEVGFLALNKLGMLNDPGPVMANMSSALLGAAGYTLGNYLGNTRRQSRRLALTLCGIGIAGGIALKHDIPEKIQKAMSKEIFIDNKKDTVKSPQQNATETGFHDNTDSINAPMSNGIDATMGAGLPSSPAPSN